MNAQAQQILTPVLAILFCYTAAVGAQPQPTEEPSQHVLRFDPARSSVAFELDATLHKVKGSANLQDGAVSWNPRELTCAGSIVIDATSLQSGSRRRDREMHAKVLESADYPEIAFECLRFTGTLDDSGMPAGSITVEGTMSIHGDQHPLTIPLVFQVEDERNIVSATFDVPYVAWGMRDPSKAFLRVGKTVNIQLRLIAE